MGAFKSCIAHLTFFVNFTPMQNMKAKIDLFISDFFQRVKENSEEIPSFTRIYEADKILVESFNSTTKDDSFIQHSEIISIRKVNCEKKYLDSSILLTSLEPCIMCAGAIIKARIETVIYFAEAKPNEGISSLLPEFIYSLNYFPKIIFHKEAKIQDLFRSFFSIKR